MSNKKKNSIENSGMPPETSFPEIRKRSDRLAEHIRRQIMSGELKAGKSVLQEKEILDAFKVSKVTAREALKSLETQGLVSIKTGPGGGASVAEVDSLRATELLWNFFFPKEISLSDIYTVRKSLEPILARVVCSQLTQEDFKKLEESISRCSCVGPYTPDQRISELDFHETLASACNNPVLAFYTYFINELLKRLVENQSDIDFSPLEDMKYSGVVYHMKLIDAFRVGDADAAEKLMREHMEEAEAHMLKLVAGYSA